MLYYFCGRNWLSWAERAKRNEHCKVPSSSVSEFTVFPLVSTNPSTHSLNNSFSGLPPVTFFVSVCFRLCRSRWRTCCDNPMRWSWRSVDYHRFYLIEAYRSEYIGCNEMETIRYSLIPCSLCCFWSCMLKNESLEARPNFWRIRYNSKIFFR